MIEFGFTFIVGPAENVPAYVAWEFDDKRALGDETPSQRGRFYYKRGSAPVVWMPRWPRTPAEQGTLCHEMGHVVTAMFDHIGQPIASEHDEVFCHALGYAVRKVLEASPRGKR